MMAMTKIALRCRHCGRSTDHTLIDLILWPWPRHCDDYSRPADEAAWALAKTGMKEADDALQAAGLPSLARIVAQAYWRPQP